MTIARKAHELFGGCVSVRCMRGVWGVWSPMDAALWADTASATHHELAAKLEGMAPRRVACRPDEPWTVPARKLVAAEKRRRGAAKLRGRRRAAAVSVDRTIVLPLRLVSEANARGHYMARARRARGQRGATKLALHARFGAPPAPPVRVTLTRIGPRKLDGDNLQGAGKAVRDGVADWLGVDDGDESKVTWAYEQEATGQRVYAVRIAVEVVR